MDAITAFIVMQLGIDPATFGLILGVIIAIANLVGKSIPSSSTGALGVVRKICLVIGLYVPQKVTSNLSTKNVAEAMAATLPDGVIKEAADSLPSAVKIGTDFGSVAGALVSVARGDKPSRPYETGGPEQGAVVPDEFRTDGPFAEGKSRR